MTLQQLQYFVVSCRYGNISHAAKEFDVSQPSVSSAIKKMETEFGVRLIRRIREGFVLTEEGERFRKMAEALVFHAESVEKAMLSMGEKRMFLRLGVPPMVGAALFPSIYSRFSAAHGEVELLTSEMGRRDLLGALDDGLLDLAFLPHSDAFPEEYEALPVADFETVCCVSRDHPFHAKKSLTAFDLASEPLILFSKGFFHTEKIDSFFADGKIQPRVIHTVSQLSTVEEFAARGIAAGFLFRPIAERNENLVPVSLSPPLITTISLVRRRDADKNEGAEIFLRFVKNEFSKRAKD